MGAIHKLLVNGAHRTVKSYKLDFKTANMLLSDLEKAHIEALKHIESVFSSIRDSAPMEIRDCLIDDCNGK
jgi:hypothetical protein